MIRVCVYLQVKEWSRKIRKEGFQLDRQVRAIRTEEEKVKRSLKQAATRGDKDTCTILAKEIVNARKAVTRIHASKAHLNSIDLQMKNQLATLRVAGSLEKSTTVMVAMQNLVRLPEIAGVMQEMSKEMMKAGIIEEMLEETMESVEDTEDLEEEVQAEVDKVCILYINEMVLFDEGLMDLVQCILYRCSTKSQKANWAPWNHRQKHWAPKNQLVSSLSTSLSYI